jgi:hypothetical protein
MPPKKAKKSRSTIERTEPIKMTFGFAIRAAMIAGKWTMPGYPSAQELSALTGKSPDMFPRQWTLEEAQYALDHTDDLIGVVTQSTEGEVP